MIRQGGVVGKSKSAVIWIDRVEPNSEIPNKVVAYLEQDIAVEFDTADPPAGNAPRPPARIRGKSWMGHFHSIASVNVRVGDDTRAAEQGQEARPATHDLSEEQAREAQSATIERGHAAWGRRHRSSRATRPVRAGISTRQSGVATTTDSPQPADRNAR